MNTTGIVAMRYVRRPAWLGFHKFKLRFAHIAHTLCCLRSGRTEKLSPLELCQIAPPAEFADGLPSADDWCYEVDPDNKSQDNPHAVGADFGRILYPHGEDIKLWWTDKSEDITLKKFLKLCPRVGKIVQFKGLPWKIDSYGEQGCVLVEPEDNSDDANKKASPAVTRKRKQQQKIKARKSTPPRKKKKPVRTKKNTTKRPREGKRQCCRPAQ